jgi:hypothetical protein
MYPLGIGRSRSRQQPFRTGLRGCFQIFTLFLLFMFMFMFINKLSIVI